jgi:hypothetical protein
MGGHYNDGVNLKRKLTSSGDCINGHQFYPLRFGDSATEQITCMSIVQSDQNGDGSSLDDWIAIAGVSSSANVVATTSTSRTYMALF